MCMLMLLVVPAQANGPSRKTKKQGTLRERAREFTVLVYYALTAALPSVRRPHMREF